MLYTALVVALGGGLASQTPLGVTYPDQLDILRGADTTPQIDLVLDTSGSMGDESWQGAGGWGCFPSTCSYYFANRPAPTATNFFGNPDERDCNGAGDPLSKNDQLKAALTGCTSDIDGILDKWDQRVLFSIREFGGARTGLLSEYDITFANHGALETAVLGLLDDGGTPLADAYVQAAEHITNFWSDSNTEQCRQNYIVLMTDGEGNGFSRSLNFLPNVNGITVSDAGTCFPNLCGTPPFADAAAAYLYDGKHTLVTGLTDTIDNSFTPPRTILATDPNSTVDALPNVIGVQPISTYTIGFQAPFNGQLLLQAMANEGRGFFYNASNYQQLDQAFTDIITNIVNRSSVTFSAGSVQTDGIFSGNHIYSTAFRPADVGNWLGTTRKYCIYPPANNPGSLECIFAYPGGDPTAAPVTNPAALDVWAAQTGRIVTTQEATQGGSGWRIWNDLFGGVTAFTAPVPSNPLNRRTILTWRHGATGYVPVDGTFPQADTWTNSPCEHYSLLNKLHGYTYDVNDCAAGDLAPDALEEWPEGDTVNGATVIMKYSPTCESASDNCFIATVSNDGMLHFFNAYSGIETSAVIPADLWQPNSIAHHTLASITNQPNLEVARKYYFDGRLRLFHDDNGGSPFVQAQAGNGVIDIGEPAHLIAPLGRGGAAYISFPMNRFNGIPDAVRNPPRPLYPDQATGYQFLQDTWSAPFIGRFRYQGQDRAVAVFASGHRREEDAPLAQLGAVASGSGRGGQLLDTPASPQALTCNAASTDPNVIGVNIALCDPATAAGLPGGTACTASPTCSPFVLSNFCCYDSPIWGAPNPLNPTQTLAPPPWNFSTTGGAGHSIIFGPISWQDVGAAQGGVGYRVGFDRFILQPNDYIAILDSQQREAGRITGTGVDLAAGGPVFTPFVNDTSFYLQFRSDGIDDADSFMAPFNISGIEYIRRQNGGAAGSVSYPTIYVTDVNRWNGPNLDGSGGQGFSAVPGAGDTRQADALLARITSSCSGSTGPNETCIDASTNTNTGDLAYMTCGVSSELSVYTEGDLLRSIYFIDRCGQIFKIDYNLRNPGNEWSARRLLNLNNTTAGSPRVGNSKDYRQGMAQLELVLSQCNGSRSIGVFFGTGNIQRPAEFDNLMDGNIAGHGNLEHTFTGRAPAPATTQWADVMGVVYDSPSLPLNAQLSNLVNITDVVDLGNPSGTNGYFIDLLQNEKMLRKPLVLEGVAYFKTYQPEVPATECVSARGVDRFYVFNSCTGRALVDGNDFGNTINSPSDRVAYSAETDIGGDILLIAQKDRTTVTHGNLGESVAAELPKNPTSRGLKMFMWRKLGAI